jgi:hypothetical protein
VRQKQQFNNNGKSLIQPNASAPQSAPQSAPARRTYEKDSSGMNKMPDVKSLGAPKSGYTAHSTPKGASSPDRHEVTSYGDMHTVNTYSPGPKGERHIGSFMTDQAPVHDKEKGTLSFGNGNTFDMATSKQAPGGAFHENIKTSKEWRN